MEPDIIRVEKQLDFDELKEPKAWQGLPERYSASSQGFTARFTGYVELNCGGAKKAKHTFSRWLSCASRDVLKVQ